MADKSHHEPPSGVTQDERLLESPRLDEFLIPTRGACSESWASSSQAFEDLATLTRGISIFGSARTSPDDPFYQAAQETAALLVRAGFAVITGGGPGIMEAGNRGAFEAGGMSVGCNIELPHEQHRNPYQPSR